MDYAMPEMPVVLVIEDEAGDAALIHYQLQEETDNRFQVHQAASLREAAAWLEQTALLPDVVLLDLNLPDFAATFFP